MFHRCEDCGNVDDGVVIDFREEVYGTVVAHWVEEDDGWECDWESRKDEDGKVEYGEFGVKECAVCGSDNVEQYELDDAGDRVALGMRLLFAARAEGEPWKTG